ncbi:hypothetical protein ALP14_102405 [Pseudomonas amygdali pv. myricae]|uniref:Uncharacterized protein n=1 Tax=Pseudomonas amygdali pv. ulmi TaxID=251720 RepID=A0A0Q0EIS4_PSEA0|nr:hypothetical protein [Pseudomonas amygdali]KPY45754.1 Unknown protein sequence [Pseudomonas syringae pv. rhaphiolepidis]KPZ14043.1 Unknown protein sequence [Pseudomonas amygdali pv. ulmi]KPB60909.1 Unknown protein sequence [Pseudomonas amygdali pv. myricae]KPW22248.1 Unknown protein sequence [Pseudomonas amygdali pv. aesculi]RMR12430.1 hypothetical protein ALP90_00863 [Pseudomonas amygdali pv. ulmi]
MGKKLLGFHDLLKISFVHASHQRCVGLQAIRSASLQAKIAPVVVKAAVTCELSHAA